MSDLSRRDAIKLTGAASAAAWLGGARPSAAAELASNAPGRIKQSVARWCFDEIPLEKLCASVASLGMPAIDLLEVEEWPVAAEHGLAVSVGMVSAGTIEDGLNDPANHDTIVGAFERNIPRAAAAGVPNVICFFGNRRGMEDDRGIANSVECLKRCTAVAEEHDTTIVIEMLNSKVDHIDYIGDTTAYGVRVVEQVNSPKIKLLYDIYHMQIMEGDVIRTIQDNHQHFAHYHTGGVPGRAEIDESQELNYVAITTAIIETRFDGYFAHEFIPKKPDPIQSLRDAVQLCDV